MPLMYTPTPCHTPIAYGYLPIRVMFHGNEMSVNDKQLLGIDVLYLHLF